MMLQRGLGRGLLYVSFALLLHPLLSLKTVYLCLNTCTSPPPPDLPHTSPSYLFLIPSRIPQRSLYPFHTLSLIYLSYIPPLVYSLIGYLSLIFLPIFFDRIPLPYTPANTFYVQP